MPTDRRSFLRLLATLVAPNVVSVVGSGSAHAQAPAMSRVTAYAFTFAALKGEDIRLADYTGKPILIVNTASLCGYTPQYAGLQQLWSRFRERGLLVIGVPSNDFGGQEPGGINEIAHTAEQEYGVSFPMAAKVAVRGANPHPFYRWAATERPLETPRWNFHKYLIGHDGHIAAAFASNVEPMDARVVNAIAKELPRAP
jgi:glutathione peroxidase